MTILSDLTDTQCDVLKNYINFEQPFGPENAKLVKDEFSRYVLFNENNVFSQEYKRNPRIIIGRRGSGKTTITSNTKFIDEHSYIISIHPEEALATVQAISFPTEDSPAQYVESIAKIWKVFFNTLLMVEVCKKQSSSNLVSIRSYLANTDIPVESALVGVMGALRKKSHNLGVGVTSFVVSAFLESLNDGGGGYVKAKQELDQYLDKAGENAIIIVDSIEDYHLEIEQKRQVMGGLLKCVGEYGDSNRSVRLCLPAESYFEVRRCSKNPLKDFSRNLLLHWLPSEIFGIIAWRYQLFNIIHDKEKYKLLEANGFSRFGSLKTIYKLLPKEILNGLGFHEPMVTYLMRHTQLLPRQVILILNAIFARTNNDSPGLPYVKGRYIVDAITNVESTLCEEVFTAYEHKYPLAYELSRACIPEIHRVFSNADLHRAFTRHGKRVLASAGETMEYSDFKSMFVEMGIVGRVKKSTDIYSESEFEYAAPGRLSVSVDDKLCLHPIFSGEFSSCKNNGAGLVVYPQKEWLEGEDGRALRIDIGHR